LAPGRVRELAAVAREAGLAVHLDGARLFNAAAALDVDVRELTADVDSVMVSLSKGLSAPVGSVLAGTRSFIGRARKMRKLLGGGGSAGVAAGGSGTCGAVGRAGGGVGWRRGRGGQRPQARRRRQRVQPCARKDGSARGGGCWRKRPALISQTPHCKQVS